MNIDGFVENGVISPHRRAGIAGRNARDGLNAPTIEHTRRQVETANLLAAGAITEPRHTSNDFRASG